MYLYLLNTDPSSTLKYDDNPQGFSELYAPLPFTYIWLRLFQSDFSHS